MDKLTESANRLVERELAICDCVGAYSFYLHLNWHSSILQAHVFRRCIDGAPVRRGICILDLLPTRTAPTDEDIGGSTPTDCTITASHQEHSIKPDNPVTTISPPADTQQR
jgi:hypothetical protein